MGKLLVKFRSKCQSCGDNETVYCYNQAYTCSECLSMDREGVSRSVILDRNLGMFKHREVKTYWRNRNNAKYT